MRMSDWTAPTEGQGGIMGKKIRFRDANGKGVSGNFEINGGRITVSAPDGRTRMAGMDESMLNPKTLDFCYMRRSNRLSSFDSLL
jgi:hypothetical protein